MGDNMMDDSVSFAKSHKKEFIAKVVDGQVPAAKKTAIFMEGSPGAGKTEVATALEEMLSNICMIDADVFRSQFPEYNGSNSSEFQGGASLLVEYSLDYVLKKGYSFILDGTFAIGKSIENIERALKRDYLTTIYYVFQDPVIAWNFTKQREISEGRHVPKERFISAFINSRENISKVTKKFGDLVEVIIVIKDYRNEISEIASGIDNLELILPKTYSFKELEALLDD